MAIIRKPILKAQEGPDNTPQDIAGIYSDAKSIGVSMLPFDIEGYLKKKGFKILFEDLDNDLSGYIEKQHNDWAIGVNKYQSPRRQRFTLAHEYAHYLYDKDMLDREKKHYDNVLFRSGTEQMPPERTANEFAASLLMPETTFKELITKGIKTIDGLAESFNVSVAAVIYRAHKLGYTTKK